MKTVRIIGAGFSGLTLAYELSKRGIAVEIFEKKSAGGLIRSEHTPNGLAESAANGFLASDEMIDLCRELGLEVLRPRPAARRRYIVCDGKLKRWPLGLTDSLRLLKAVLSGSWRRPNPGETVRQFIERICGPNVLRNLIAPALQGIYGAQSEDLSASLVFRRPKGKVGRLVSLAGGMQVIIDTLVKNLTDRGVKIISKEVNSANELAVDGAHVVTAVPLKESLKLLGLNEPQLRMKSLISVTLWFQDSSSLPHGFGALFPPQESATALGVLFNSDVFEGRTPTGIRSETWICDGERLAHLTDSDLVSQLISERVRYFGVKQQPVSQKIFRWPAALPHFDLALEDFLNRRGPELKLKIHGNFMGPIGLSKIYSRSREMAEMLQ